MDHMVIRARNFDAMVDFYTNVLGMTLTENDGRYAVCFGAEKINLHPLKTDIRPVAANPKPGSMNYCLAAEGRPEAIREKLAAAGFLSIDSQIHRRHGAQRDFDSFYVFDPDENLVEIGVYDPSDVPFRVVGIDHMVIVTNHYEETLAFYRDVLGIAVGRNDTQCTLSFGRQKFNLHPEKPIYKPAEKNAAYGNCDFCLLVEERIEEIQAQLLAAGVSVELGVVRRNGAAGALNSIYLRDPDGNLVEISQVIA